MTGAPIRLIENGESVEATLDAATALALGGSGIVDARPVVGTPLWRLTPGSKVGTVRIGAVQVEVAPKIPIERVVFLLEHTAAGITWRPELVGVHQADSLLLAVVEAFERVTSRSLRQGLLQGYRTVEEELAVVRGRIREADQMRRRFALPLPVEVRYDDYTADIPENRLLRAATLVALRLPGVAGPLRHRLARLDLQLGDVTPVRARRLLEPWRPTCLNARLHAGLHLAEVIVDSASFEPGGDGLAVTGFVLNMAKVFEDFVCAELGRQLRRLGWSTRSQHVCHLDEADQVRMRPDLVALDDHGSVVIVVDAKYKAEKPAGFPDADLYQMLAYCTALGLPVGHLVYAQGNEDGRAHVVRGSGVALHAHALNLDQAPGALLESISELAWAVGMSNEMSASGGAAEGAAVPAASSFPSPRAR